MRMTKTYIVTEAPGYHGDHLTIVNSHKSAEAAKRNATKGWAAYETSIPYAKGDRLVRDDLRVMVRVH